MLSLVLFGDHSDSTRKILLKRFFWYNNKKKFKKCFGVLGSEIVSLRDLDLLESGY